MAFAGWKSVSNSRALLLTSSLVELRRTTLKLPQHPKLAVHERNARYMVYHDFGKEEGVSEQQLGAKTRCNGGERISS
jgi:hypothetical protein